VTTPDVEQIIRRAIHDPGQHVPRGDNYREPMPSWQAREVVAALTAAGYTLVRPVTPEEEQEDAAWYALPEGTEDA
jgi:hypothetical protein